MYMYICIPFTTSYTFNIPIHKPSIYRLILHKYALNLPFRYLYNIPSIYHIIYLEYICNIHTMHLNIQFNIRYTLNIPWIYLEYTFNTFEYCLKYLKYTFILVAMQYFQYTFSVPLIYLYWLFNLSLIYNFIDFLNTPLIQRLNTI